MVPDEIPQDVLSHGLPPEGEAGTAEPLVLQGANEAFYDRSGSRSITGGEACCDGETMGKSLDPHRPGLPP